MNFTEYPKIETLFDRSDDFTVDTSRLRRSVLSTIQEWDVTEKIDGTNVRVMLSEAGDVEISGRTDTSQLSAKLLMTLVKMFPAEKLKSALWLDETPTDVILFGEGYGAGIQSGGIYRPDMSFRLFDVLVAGKWWLDIDDVRDVADKLSIDPVPFLGRMTLEQIVELVKTPFSSRIGNGMAEGIVAKPIETLFDKRGERIIIKLKTKDFRSRKRQVATK